LPEKSKQQTEQGQRPTPEQASGKSNPKITVEELFKGCVEA